MDSTAEMCSIDVYYTTAQQIFEYCGASKDDNLRVDALMDKLEPFIKTNKSEYSHLKSLLDPEHRNPTISVTMLSDALNKYSEGQKDKSELEESFNLRAGPVPQDSDSGISSDGFQLIEELQCELREKARVTSQLRSQLDFTDRQHEEAVATLTAERDSLRGHLNMLREENVTLVHVRRDYEEVCDRLCNSETALADAHRQIDAAKRRSHAYAEQIDVLENDKATLQEQLRKSNAECHRINEMYASRQSALIEQNESLRTECADLSARLHDQEEVMQMIVKEKVQLEMELKDVFNKSNIHPRLNHSIDISYTDDQLLTALDSLNSDSKFVNVGQDNTQDEDFFIKPFKEESGRLSLFDEIRLSFSHSTKYKDLDISRIATNETQTDTDIDLYFNNNNSGTPCGDCLFKCKDCVQNKEYTTKLESDFNKSEYIINDLRLELERYDVNMKTLKEMNDEETEIKKHMNASIEALNKKVTVLEERCRYQSAILDIMEADEITMNKNCATQSSECQTEIDSATISTQTQLPCLECEKRSVSVPAKRSWKNYAWSGIKSLFSLFATLCFVGALFFLYQVSHYHFASRRCLREAPAVPWKWLSIHDLLDHVFRIEYVGEVPM